MNLGKIEISVRGRPVLVPAIRVEKEIIHVVGKWLKIASVIDEEWHGGDAINDPAEAIRQIQVSGLKTDLFTFCQKLPSRAMKYNYPHIFENVAAISTVNYDDWWENKLPQETRKNVRRSKKRGVVVREMEFGDDLIQGIIRINNETPIRQGRPFWHYGKDFDIVKKEYSSFQDRSIYLGAYSGNELVGFMKIVDMGEIAAILQLLCMNRDQDKRPANALIAEAVKICNLKNFQYLVYGQYIYGNNSQSPLTEFKRRNGFEKILLPRYYIPLSLKGRVAMQLGLHLGLRRLVPGKIHHVLSLMRARWYERKYG